MKKILTPDNLDGCKYGFSPAACYPPKHSGLGIYVRYKKEKTQQTIVREYKQNYIWLDCPDREVFMTIDHNKLMAHVPFDGNYDEYFDLDYMDEDGNDDIGLLMFNYLQHVGQPAPNIRRNGVHPDPQGRKIKYIADSGGFQIMSGVTNFIDPLDVAKWYGNNIDWGMVLDIPIISDEVPLDTVRRLAHVQKKNSDLMLEHLPPHVELINIVHGISPAQKQAYAEIVQDDRIRRLAMGGMYYNNVVFATNELYKTISLNTHYHHLHILGVYNVAQMAIMIRLANSPMNKMFITSDASTPIQSARSKLYHTQLGQMSGPKRMPIGDSDRYPTTHNQFTCQCKVCRALKYTDVLASIDGALSTFTLAYHNTQEVVRFTRQLNDVCRTTSHAEYKKLVASILKNHRSAKLTLQAIDFIDYADAYGLPAAQKRYQHYLNISSIVKETVYGILFDKAAITDKEQAKVEEEENELSITERMDEIASRYEDYHAKSLTSADMAKGKKATRKSSKRGSGRAAGTVKAAGLKSQVKKKKDKAKKG